jgi:hypothetical protein
MHNNLPTLKDGSSIQVGAKMAHNHTFACPAFALQNQLAAGNSIPKWSPRALLGLNLGQSPMHARNVYLVLNLSTGLLSPQYHCCFDDFFETTKYGAADVAVSSTWQQLAGFDCATDVDSQTQASTLHSRAQRETPSDVHVPSEELNDSGEHLKFTNEFHNNVAGKTTGVTTPQNELPRSQGSQGSEGAAHKNTVNMSAGVIRRGRVRTMSRKMADSVSKQEFFGNSQMHYMASQAALEGTEEDIFHNAHLELQERMSNPVAFHAEMMGDIMYLHVCVCVCVCVCFWPPVPRWDPVKHEIPISSLPLNDVPSIP